MYETRFLDTLAFMSSSLESLANRLRFFSNDVIKLRNIFKNTSNEFKNYEQVFLTIQKVVYLYDYINNFNKFYENYVPYIKSFYSKLNKTECNAIDYEHAKNVYKHLNVKIFYIIIILI